MTFTGCERLDVVQLSHWNEAEMMGEAKRDTTSFSESLLWACVQMFIHKRSRTVVNDVSLQQ